MWFFFWVCIDVYFLFLVFYCSVFFISLLWIRLGVKVGGGFVVVWGVGLFGLFVGCMVLGF